MTTKRPYSWERVRRYLSGQVSLGLDPSGRRIWVTRYMRRWLRSLERHLGWEPVIVQGGFMTRNGGGAKASAGYHDGGGCIDFRTRTLSPEQKNDLIRTASRGGAAIWLRTPVNSGMDEHAHMVLGADYKLAPGARNQWRAYLNGRDGLASNGIDYHRNLRPKPLVTRPPASWVSKRKTVRK